MVETQPHNKEKRNLRNPFSLKSILIVALAAGLIASNSIQVDARSNPCSVTGSGVRVRTEASTSAPIIAGLNGTVPARGVVNDNSSRTWYIINPADVGTSYDPDGDGNPNNAYVASWVTSASGDCPVPAANPVVPVTTSAEAHHQNTIDLNGATIRPYTIEDLWTNKPIYHGPAAIFDKFVYPNYPFTIYFTGSWYDGSTQYYGNYLQSIFTGVQNGTEVYLDGKTCGIVQGLTHRTEGGATFLNNLLLPGANVAIVTSAGPSTNDGKLAVILNCR